MNDPTMPQILCVTGGAQREREELDEEEAGHGQKVRSWEQKGGNRPEGTSSSEDGPAAQHQQEAEPAPEVRVDADDQPSNQEGEISKQGGDNTGQDMRSSTAPRETKGEGPEREKEGKEGEDGRGMKRKRGRGGRNRTGNREEKGKTRTLSNTLFKKCPYNHYTTQAFCTVQPTRFPCVTRTWLRGNTL